MKFALDIQFFGGRGASSSNGGGGGSATSVTVQSGDVVDLSEFPLKYGGLDKSLTKEQREAIEAFEKKREKAKIEYALLVDKDGNVTYTGKGGKGSVKTPNYAWVEGGVMTHNHPRGTGEEGYLGGTFSFADTTAFAWNKAKTIRASAYEGTYSMSKGKNFDRNGFIAYSKSLDSKFNQGLKQRNGKLKEQYKNNEISYNDYLKSWKGSFNQALVELHNGYAQGAKKYGYTYTLEKRGK